MAGRRGGRHTGSFVQDQGEYTSKCGYCGSTRKTSVSHGMSAHTLTVEDYQELLDRGWRRSGKWLYKPTVGKTCCPPYTIRLPAEHFVPTKEQRRVLRRMDRYLTGSLQAVKSDLKINEEGLHSEGVVNGRGISEGGLPSSVPAVQEKVGASRGRGFVPKYVPISNKQQVLKEREGIENLQQGSLVQCIEASIGQCFESGQLPRLASIPKVTVRPAAAKIKAQVKPPGEELLYTSNVAFVVAAALRRQNDSAAVSSKDDEPAQSPQHIQPCKPLKVGLDPISVAERLADHLHSDSVPGCLKVTACKGHLNFTRLQVVGGNGSDHVRDSKKLVRTNETEKGTEGLCQQTGVQNEKNDHFNEIKVSSQRHQNLIEHLNEGDIGRDDASSGGHHKLEISMTPSRFLEEEFQLYRKYQVRVHGDDESSISTYSYTQFLVETPLIFQGPGERSSVPACGFGSFHQQYRIDGRLVAVGVVDVLPKCLSSKYLFWDPDLAFLSLGKFSALQEIDWVRKAHKECSSLEYYYLGFYIHTCPKMKYKAAYSPSELLCPLRLQWVPYSTALTRLQQSPATALTDPPSTCTTCCESEKPSMTTEVAQTASSALEAAIRQLKDPVPTDERSNEKFELQALSEQNEAGPRDEFMEQSGSGDESDSYEERSGDESDGDEERSGEVSGVSSIHDAATSLSLTKQELADLERQTKEGINSIPLLVDEVCLSFRELRRLLLPHGEGLLVQQLSRYFQLVGPRVAPKIGYSLA